MEYLPISVNVNINDPKTCAKSQIKKYICTEDVIMTY